MPDLICQGDVNFIPAPTGRCPDCGASFDRSTATKRPNGVVAYGEVTGHSHAVLDRETADVFETPSGLWLEKHVGDVSITHQEHAPVAPAAPLSHIHIDQVFDYSAARLRDVVD